MTVSRYWFARTFPVDQVRNTRMAPISSEGRAVVAMFVGCMIAGAVGLITFSFTYRQPAVGVLTLFGFTLVGGAALVAALMLRGDKQHTVEDYKQGRVRQS